MNEELKAVWKQYVLFFAGLGLVWLSRKVEGTLSSVLIAVGAVAMVTGFLLVMWWHTHHEARGTDDGSQKK